MAGETLGEKFKNNLQNFLFKCQKDPSIDMKQLCFNNVYELVTRDFNANKLNLQFKILFFNISFLKK